MSISTVLLVYPFVFAKYRLEIQTSNGFGLNRNFGLQRKFHKDLDEYLLDSGQYLLDDMQLVLFYDGYKRVV